MRYRGRKIERRDTVTVNGREVEITTSFNWPLWYQVLISKDLGLGKES